MATHNKELVAAVPGARVIRLPGQPAGREGAGKPSPASAKAEGTAWPCSRA